MSFKDGAVGRGILSLTELSFSFKYTLLIFRDPTLTRFQLPLKLSIRICSKMLEQCKLVVDTHSRAHSQLGLFSLIHTAIRLDLDIRQEVRRELKVIPGGDGFLLFFIGGCGGGGGGGLGGGC